MNINEIKQPVSESVKFGDNSNFNLQVLFDTLRLTVNHNNIDIESGTNDIYYAIKDKLKDFNSDQKDLYISYSEELQDIMNINNNDPLYEKYSSDFQEIFNAFDSLLKMKLHEMNEERKAILGEVLVRIQGDLDGNS